MEMARLVVRQRALPRHICLLQYPAYKYWFFLLTHSQTLRANCKVYAKLTPYFRTLSSNGLLLPFIAEYYHALICHATQRTMRQSHSIAEKRSYHLISKMLMKTGFSPFLPLPQLFHKFIASVLFKSLRSGILRPTRNPRASSGLQTCGIKGLARSKAISLRLCRASQVQDRCETSDVGIDYQALVSRNALEFRRSSNLSKNRLCHIPFSIHWPSYCRIQWLWHRWRRNAWRIELQPSPRFPPPSRQRE
jgi:hypothetical protein